MAIAEAGARQRVTITDNVILDFTGLFREAEKRGKPATLKREYREPYKPTKPELRGMIEKTQL